MFYRRKFYLVKKEFVETFNDHFNHTNLPNQIRHGSRLIGRWMKDHDEETVEIFAIWEYDSQEDYMKIETSIRNDQEHLKRIRDWYEEHGGREFVAKEYIIEMRNEALETTVR